MGHEVGHSKWLNIKEPGEWSRKVGDKARETDGVKHRAAGALG